VCGQCELAYISDGEIDLFILSLFWCVKEDDFECVPTSLMEQVLKFLNVSALPYLSKRERL